MKQSTMITLVGILCITVLEGIALAQGVDGHVLSAVMTAIGTMVGYQIGKRGK